MTVSLALLRGVNVGGKAKLPMRDLAEIFAAAGAQDTQTYIQSGNVLFRAEAPELVTEVVTNEIRRRFGYPGRTVTLALDEMQRVVERNPFANAGAPEPTLHAYLLGEAASPSAVRRLDPDRSPPDAFAVDGRAIYLHLPDGMARTRLTNAYFDAQLSTLSTARNWRTITTLYERMRILHQQTA